VFQRFDLDQYFIAKLSGADLKASKPHPEIFIKTADQLNVKPIDCLVIEDSFNGLLSAKSALMKVIAIPEKENYNDPRFTIADFQLNSLSEITTLNFE